MRNYLLVAIVLGTTGIVSAQEPQPPIPPRFGVVAAPEAFPQRSPKEVLTSAARAVERGKIDYLVAHLIEPTFVDTRVAAKARLIEDDVDRELRAERDAQRGKILTTGVALPVDPNAFLAFVQQTTRERAFRQVVRDVRDTLTENPDHIKELRRFARDGIIVDAGDTSTASLRDVKDRQVFFRKDGTRWFVEDRQRPEPMEKK